MTLKLYVQISFFITAIILGTIAQAAPTPSFLVVLDPGHGGADHGAAYKHSSETIYEKNVALHLAQEIAAELKRRKIRAVLTRKNDQTLPLAERTAMANRLKAELFLSIHLNSADERVASTAQGVETYILNLSSDASSKRLAHLENSVLQGSIADNQPQSEVGLIVKDLLHNGNIKESHRFACLVQNQIEMKSLDTAVNRGVRQALFYVLLGADMPGALLEAGFLQNAKDRQRALLPGPQNPVVQGVAEAVTNYRDRGKSAAVSRMLSSCKMD